MSLPAQGTVIARLRLRGVSADPLAARLRLASVLSAADLAPVGLPATTILIIRALRDPQPGRLRLRHAGQSPPCGWQQAVGQNIDALARRAARPAHGFVPDSADAVVFMDRSELLACLARDWCATTIAARWWWRSLLRDPDLARAVAAEWLQSPEYAPAALQRLAASREAATFVQRLDRDVVHELLERVVERFGVASLHPILRHRSSASADPGVGVRVSSAEKSPWLPWVPETNRPGLTPQQQDLLGIALLVQRAPSVARSARLVDAIQRSQDRGRSGADSTPAGAVPETGRGHAIAPGGMVDRRHPVSAVALSTGRAPQDPPPCAVAAVDSSLAGRLRVEVHPGRSAHGVESSASVHARSSRAPAIDMDRKSVATPQATKTPDPGFDPFHEWSAARSVKSGHGGALFLINLALFLELYGDFSQPAKPGIELPIWDFVALLGERYAGGRFRRDPLWRLLAELAGRRPDEEPGLHYRPPADWRAPLGWLKPLSRGDRWEWSGRDCRLKIQHPAGFVVIDVAAPECNYIDVLAAELAPYRAAGFCVRVARRRAAPHSARGTRACALAARLGWLAPYVHARLHAALGAGAVIDAARRLCATPARLQLTATHLDAHFALAELPIAVRLAGLDRDPGWVPAAGRYIRFHFD